MVETVANLLTVAGMRQHGNGYGSALFNADRMAVADAVVAVLLRQHAVGFAEAAREGLGVVVTAFAGDVGEGLVAVGDEPGSAVQPPPFDGLVHGFAHQAAVDAVPVPRRQPGFFGDAVESGVVGVVFF